MSEESQWMSREFPLTLLSLARTDPAFRGTPSTEGVRGLAIPDMSFGNQFRLEPLQPPDTGFPF